jgi:serine/threonine-protein kinase
MSPEQARGEEVDPRSDIYSLGAIAYECLAGTPPYSGSDQKEVLIKQCLEDPAPLLGLLPATEASAELAGFVERLMCRDRELRLQSVREVVDEIESLQQRLASSPELRPKPRGISLRTPTRHEDPPAAVNPDVTALVARSLLDSDPPRSQAIPRQISAPHAPSAVRSGGSGPANGIPYVSSGPSAPGAPVPVPIDFANLPPGFTPSGAILLTPSGASGPAFVASYVRTASSLTGFQVPQPKVKVGRVVLLSVLLTALLTTLGWAFVVHQYSPTKGGFGKSVLAAPLGPAPLAEVPAPPPSAPGAAAPASTAPATPPPNPPPAADRAQPVESSPQPKHVELKRPNRRALPPAAAKEGSSKPQGHEETPADVPEGFVGVKLKDH